MQVKYSGPIVDFKICRRNFVEEYDFSTGKCNCVEEDAEKLVTLYPDHFTLVKPKKKKKAVKLAPLETMDTLD